MSTARNRFINQATRNSRETPEARWCFHRWSPPWVCSPPEATRCSAAAVPSVGRRVWQGLDWCLKIGLNMFEPAGKFQNKRSCLPKKTSGKLQCYCKQLEGSTWETMVVSMLKTRERPGTRKQSANAGKINAHPRLSETSTTQLPNRSSRVPGFEVPCRFSEPTTNGASLLKTLEPNKHRWWASCNIR